MRPILAFSAALLAGAAGLPASAATIDLSSAPASFTSYTEAGATLTNVANSSNTVTDFSPNGTSSWFADGSPRPEFRADFSSAASFVSVDLGDFNQDQDTLFLEIFNGSDASLGFTSLLIGGADQTMHTLSLSGAGIAYAIFGARAPAGDGNSIFADNITFTLGGGPIPEPGTWAMLIAGFGVVGAAMRRRGRRLVKLA